MWAISWYDEDYNLVEWDIIPDERLDDDERIGYDFRRIIDSEEEGFVDLEAGEYCGPDTHPDAYYVLVAGPFDNLMAAQYYIDSEVSVEEDY